MRIGSGLFSTRSHSRLRLEPRPFSPEGYATWRKTLPFTDEQFAQVYEASADQWERDGNEYKRDRALRNAARCRRGRISSYDANFCLGELVKSCAVCGKKALYRFGSSGRCSTHRLVQDAHVLARRDRLDSAAKVWGEARTEYDRQQRARTKLRRCKRGGE